MYLFINIIKLIIFMSIVLDKKLITSESVGPGHPDKICDQISDAILDNCLAFDKSSKVACEVFASNHLIVIGGEITTKAYIDVVKTAWDVLEPLGYNESDFTIISNINSQSLDINQAVVKNNEILAGDQGIVFGFACDETEDYMPLPITIANEIISELCKKVKNNKLFKYDMKSQVTIDYSDPNNLKIFSCLVSIQHDPSVTQDDIIEFVKPTIINIAKKYQLNNDFEIIINPSGKFTIGGPIGDTGLTGRKIIVDTYGGYSKHGGGAFSGKDPSKVDRSGSYFARYIAKNIVASGIAKKCEIQLAFGIGLSEPIAIYIDTFGTSQYSNAKILKLVNQIFDFKVNSFINNLKLFNPIYKSTAVLGHFGNNQKNASWEQIDKINELKNLINKE